jgi:phospholipase C
MNPIKHLIILTMENRSFDHYLGSLTLEGRADVDGLPTPLPQVPNQNGQAVTAWNIDGISPRYGDPPHSWDAAHADFHDGANDGFVIQYQLANPAPANPAIPMGFYTRATLPALYALADEFTICDRWFCSLLSSTWPNRKYLLSGRRDDDRDTSSLPPPLPGFGTTPFLNFLEDQPDPDTPGGRLTWKCYYTDLPFLAFWYKFAAFHFSNFARVVDFVSDCREDRLPTVSVIDPAFTVGDDHPPHDPQLGQKFIGLVVDALTNSESWASSALLILYDENGGFYDHVPPPPAATGDSPLGFRVPALVISPYVRKGFACKTAFDHTSVMKSIAQRWDVTFGPEFGDRWRQASSIWDDCFDFSQPPRPQGIYTGAPLQDLNWGADVYARLTQPRNLLEGLLEHVFLLPELKALDRRSSVFDTLWALEQQVVALKRMSR